MKKCILLSLFGLLSLVPKLQATHLMGGDIIVQQLSGLTYLVQLTTYRDTMGIPMQTTATFTFKNSSGTTILTTTTGYDTIISGNTLPMYPYGVEVYFFRDTVTLPSTGTFSVGWSDCCRNGAIQNLSSPLSESMFLQTDFTVDSIPNSTPFFLVPAAIFLPVNTPWQYNPLPFDPDGDSLYWSISSPLNGWNTPCAGFTIPPGSSANPITINPITGTNSWTATTTGNFVFTVLVDEYRNGVHFGSIRRDMQFIVVTPNGQGPQWNVNIPTDSLGNLHINLVQFSSYQLNVMGYNPSGAPLNMQAYGEPFFTQPNPAVFTMQGQGINDTVFRAHQLVAYGRTSPTNPLHIGHSYLRWVFDPGSVPRCYRFRHGRGGCVRFKTLPSVPESSQQLYPVACRRGKRNRDGCERKTLCIEERRLRVVCGGLARGSISPSSFWVQRGVFGI